MIDEEGIPGRSSYVLNLIAEDYLFYCGDIEAIERIGDFYYSWDRYWEEIGFETEIFNTYDENGLPNIFMGKYSSAVPKIGEYFEDKKKALAALKEAVKKHDEALKD